MSQIVLDVLHSSLVLSFPMSQIVLDVLHTTLILSFYIDEVLTFSNGIIIVPANVLATVNVQAADHAMAPAHTLLATADSSMAPKVAIRVHKMT